jgi:hypothetical protein
MKFERRVFAVEATQWFKDGDHAQVHMLPNPLPGVRPLGWLSSAKGVVAVGRGDWIVEDEFGEFKILSDEVFKKIYKEAS